MIKCSLTRLDSSDQGTFGRLAISDFGVHWYSAELPWRDNIPHISCIPEGTYTVVWTKSKAFGRYTYQILDVQGRTGVRIHVANLMGDREKGYKAQLEGCVALGEKVGYWEGQKALLLSSPAVGAFERILNKRPFILEIGYA